MGDQMTKSETVDRVVAVHEAGHVVGAIITAALLDYSPMEMVLRVDFFSMQAGTDRKTVEGQPKLGIAAEVETPLFSKSMVAFLEAKKPITDAEFMTTFAEMGAAGIDLKVMYRAKCIEFLFGAVAEAKFRGLPLEQVFYGISCKGDNEYMLDYGALCGFTAEQIAASLIQAAEVATKKIVIPQVWDAITALADEFKLGCIDGSVATAIVMQALSQSETAFVTEDECILPGRLTGLRSWWTRLPWHPRRLH
jgi:hypothetical protein